jgi:hypothetical protein
MKDIERIKRHLKALRAAPWLGQARKWWPDYLFHFTDISNAVRILQDGELVCRSRSKMARDIASSQVISQTGDAWKDHVRLYFRPRTPTQYHNEGFRPSNCFSPLQAHCPMPIFFLFDSESLLTLPQACYSDGNLAVDHPKVGDDAAFLESIPFEKVFHDSWLTEDEKRNIIYHRHAEVLVPDKLDLHALRWICCRTEAELCTLRHLLSANKLKKHIQKVKIGKTLYHRRWTFVESAELEQRLVTVRFNRSSQAKGPFSAHLRIQAFKTRSCYEWRNESYIADDLLKVSIPQLPEYTPYEARLSLDDALAYADNFLTADSLY